MQAYFKLSNDIFRKIWRKTFQKKKDFKGYWTYILNGSK